MRRIPLLTLALTTALVGASFFLPFWQKTGEYEGLYLDAWSMVRHTEVKDLPEVRDMWFMGALGVAAVLVAIYSIFRHGNWLVQMKLGALLSLFLAGYLGIATYQIYTARELFASVVPDAYGFGFYLPIAGFLLNVVGNRTLASLARQANR